MKASKKMLLGCFLVFSMILKAQTPDQLLLKDYRPVSIFKIPVTSVTKAKFNTIDIHSHPYALNVSELAEWTAVMDAAGIEKTIILTGSTGEKFNELMDLYSTQKNRYDLWCGIDFTDCDKPGWTQKAIAELERCYKAGAKGVGELSDKGLGLNSRINSTRRIHLNDPDLQPIFQKCAELGLPVNVHVADPIWSYQKMDSTNDGLMNAYKWRIEVDKEGLYLHDELLKTLEKVVRDNPNTTFIACHFANCDFDLDRLGRYLDAYPNLYTDNSARFGETSVIPRRTAEFYEKYQNRILFGTDMGRQAKMYNTVFRVLESNDEHFYDFDYYNYHWPCNGLNLSDKILKKIYYKNAKKILN